MDIEKIIDFIQEEKHKATLAQKKKDARIAIDWEPTDEWYENLSHDAEPVEETGEAISKAILNNQDDEWRTQMHKV